MQLRFLFLTISLFICCPLCSDPAITEQEAYGPTPPTEYLLGKFAVDKHPLFVSIDPLGIPTKGRGGYMRKETAQAFLKMYKDFHAAHPKIDLWVTSATRNWFDQRFIWESKWNGQTLIEGKALNKTIPDPTKRAYKILEFSSMPGTSRHHWGTDFDINVLTNEYYKTGDGLIIYNWLTKNAAKYGFCQPYIAGRKKGYFEERWHWSYLPLSKQMLSDWQSKIGDQTKPLAGFAGSETSTKLARTYVESINPACK